MSYESYFSSVYDTFTDSVGYEKRAEYICSLLNKNGITEGTVLDAACGTGSIGKCLLEQGFEVVANDISVDMLNIAREKLSVFGERVVLLCQDMCELDLFGTVDAAVCCLDSVNHILETEDLFAAFSKISLFMRSGGIFIFDVNTQYKHKNILSDNTFVYEDDDKSFLVWQNSECDEDFVVEMYIDVFIKNADGTYNRQSEVITERAYSENTLTDLLKKADFAIIGIYGDLSEKSPENEEERVYFVARKK